MDYTGQYSLYSKFDCYGELAASFSECHCTFYWFDCCSPDCHEGAPSCHTCRNCYQKGHSWRHCEPGRANCFKCAFVGSEFDPNGSILPYCYCCCDSVERHLVNSTSIHTSYQYHCPKVWRDRPFSFNLHCLISIFVARTWRSCERRTHSSGSLARDHHLHLRLPQAHHRYHRSRQLRSRSHRYW